MMSTISDVCIIAAWFTFLWTTWNSDYFIRSVVRVVKDEWRKP